MLHEKRYFMFFDFPKDDALRETGTPLHKDKNRFFNLDEDGVKAILKSNLKKRTWKCFLFGQLESF
jgi:hypothetical protein